MPLDRLHLEALHVKYTEIRRLRILALEAPSADPKASMVALAARFPGALREIDELALTDIDAKLHALSATLADPAHEQRWMEATALFHVLMRGALCAKRWLAGKKKLDSDSPARFAASVEGSPDAAEALLWIDDLAALAKPPRGRITDLVYARIARALDISEEDARRAVFKSPR